jgi:transcriptional regulator with XRE-family HTH domain
MLVGERLKQLREERNMSQGDIEHKSGLLRCYVSRCENGHTVPSIDTLEKWTRALGVPLWKVFAEEGTKAPKTLLKSITEADLGDNKILRPFLKLLPKISSNDRKTLLKVAAGMGRGK